ncbi:pyridoxal phosphate-dependent transferase [Halteromyces radiatus]|uniref:pyridoxal phosphate-dependent transferase n=1 Tax=Halteromyces radiatus TaxID=101107 RepID=UPI00221F9A85|nr:pyridoxal phosphate-dependent transferase [Halteromyces radiatus]KAI8093005.1 pyridoxal phosphate-dependent transferase [Halteromyces radiatus]
MVLLSFQVHKDDESPAPSESESMSQGERFEYSNAVPIYGSHWSAEDLPKYRIPKVEMPPHVCYRMIKDELALDGNPALNLASFVTTYMDAEANQLIQDTAAVNIIDVEMYPQSAAISGRCVNMLANLFHSPNDDESGQAIGTSTIGSSEAVILAVLAMKRSWQERRRAKGLSIEKPNLVLGANCQVCWKKALLYLEIEPREISVSNECLCMDPAKAVDEVDENTIGVAAILGSTYTGHYEDVKTLDKLLDQICREKNLDIGIHVDAASGGFVAPFIKPNLEWDFRLKRVMSINVSGHKYGMVYTGVGWCIWRNSSVIPKSIIFYVNYLGTDQASLTMNFSKSASPIVAQYYMLLRLGEAGYRRIISNLITISDYIANKLVDTGRFILLSETEGRGLPLVAFHLKHKQTYDEFDLASKMRERGWIIPAYTMAPSLDHMKLLRIVVREDMSRNRADILLRDINASLEALDTFDEKMIQNRRENVIKFSHKSSSHHKAAAHPEKLKHEAGEIIRSHIC